MVETVKELEVINNRAEWRADPGTFEITITPGGRFANLAREGERIDVEWSGGPICAITEELAPFVRCQIAAEGFPWDLEWLIFDAEYRQWYVRRTENKEAT